MKTKFKLGQNIYVAYTGTNNIEDYRVIESGIVGIDINTLRVKYKIAGFMCSYEGFGEDGVYIFDNKEDAKKWVIKEIQKITKNVIESIQNEN